MHPLMSPRIGEMHYNFLASGHQKISGKRFPKRKWAVVEQGGFEPATCPVLAGDLPNGYDITSRNSINHDGTTSTSTPHHSITRN
jgi:hypothetical protein